MELFEAANDSSHQPLAYRMRPRTLDEFSGQDHIIGPGRLLRRIIQADRLSSLIFYGPPGTGKTTLAWIIANTTESHFISLNAVLTGVKDLRKAIEEAKDHRSLHGRRTTLFIDEVHRWNKAQQDALLPSVENGTVILIGATTQNPFFEVISALVSRSRIFQLTPLIADDLKKIVDSAIHDTFRGYGKYRVTFENDALDHLIHICAGDARTLLNAVELAVETTPETFPPPEGEKIHVTLQIAEESIQHRAILYDKEGDYHFDSISAFIKSLRGSDPDAALYWMARMIHAGEDPRYIFRRMLILAGEDVGLADPHALSVVESAAAAFDRVGLPEGRFFLSEAALYLATASKSNSTLAFFDALKVVEEEGAAEVPNPLRDASRDKQGFGHGEGYQYPHAFRDHWVSQQYLPSVLKGKIFYEPSDQGYENSIRDLVLRRRESQLASYSDIEQGQLLTFSPPNRDKDRWLARISSLRSEALSTVREILFSLITLGRSDRVLVLNAGNGLLLWEAVRRTPEGGVWGSVDREEEKTALDFHNRRFKETERPTLILKTGEGYLDIGTDHTDLRFEGIVGFNSITKLPDKTAALAEMRSFLSDSGNMVLAETIPSKSQRLSNLLPSSALPVEVLQQFKIAEDQIYSQDREGVLAWTETDMDRYCRDAGFTDIRKHVQPFTERRRIRETDLKNWLAHNESKTSYGMLLRERLGTQYDAVETALFRRLSDTEVDWQFHVVFLRAK